jgi:hypothetical protein
MESDRPSKAFLHCRLGFINKKPKGYYFQQVLPTGCLPRSGFVQQVTSADGVNVGGAFAGSFVAPPLSFTLGLFNLQELNYGRENLDASTCGR